MGSSRREVLNVAFLGLCFTVLFAANYSLSNMQKVLSVSIMNDHPEYKVDGYVSLGLSYFIYGVFLWFIPSGVAVVGPNWGLLIGSVGYICLVSSLLLEESWVTYTGIVLGGIGGSLLWVSHGDYLILNSTPETITRDTGIFWSFYTSSMILGNIYVIFQIQGETSLTFELRQKILITLSVVSLVATVMFFFLKKPVNNNRKIHHLGALEATRKTGQIFCSEEILGLLIPFCFVGFQQSFGNGVYSACLGFTEAFGDYRKQLIPISGAVYGTGGTLGGIFHILITRQKWLKSSKYFLSILFVIGIVVEIFAFIGAYINLPNDSVFGETKQKALIEPQLSLALVCIFLVGAGDSFMNTYIYSLLSKMHPDYGAQTCALYKFVKSMAMAGYFFASLKFGLHGQMLLLLSTGVVSAITFSYTEWKMIKKSSQRE